MSDLDPQGPSQPNTAAAYQTSQNPATKNPAESSASQESPLNSKPVDQRIPQKQSTEADHASRQGTGAGSWGLGRGIHGAPPGEEAQGRSETDVGRHRELDGEDAMIADVPAGEGRVADAVAGRGEFRGTGAGGEQEDLASDLDRKKAEQAEAREAMKKQRAGNTDIGGAAGQQGGPASTIENAYQPPA